MLVLHCFIAQHLVLPKKCIATSFSLLLTFIANPVWRDLRSGEIEEHQNVDSTDEKVSDVSPAGFLPSAQAQMVSPQHLPAVLVLHHGITALSCGIWREGKSHGRETHFSLCFIAPELSFSTLVPFSFYLLVLIL